MNEVMVPITQGLAYVNRVQIRKVTHILKVDVSWFQATKVGEAVDVKYDALAHKVYFKTDYELEDGTPVRFIDDCLFEIEPTGRTLTRCEL